MGGLFGSRWEPSHLMRLTQRIPPPLIDLSGVYGYAAVMEVQDGTKAYDSARRVLIVSLAGNVILSIIKIAVGIFSRSSALVADGLHSLSDLLTDIIVWVGIRLGRAEADHNHPFGHGRIETLAGLGVGLILALTGVGLVYQSVADLAAGDFRPIGTTALAAAGLSLVVKELLFRYTEKVGRRINSPALLANAWHHRSDALSSLAALIGVGAGLIYPRLIFMDRVAALTVAGLILKVAWDMVRRAALEVVDTAPSKEMVDMITGLILSVPGVEAVPVCRIRTSGPRLLMECVIRVDGKQTLEQAHLLSERVEAAVKSGEPTVAEATVHVEPV